MPLWDTSDGILNDGNYGKCFYELRHCNNIPFYYNKKRGRIKWLTSEEHFYWLSEILGWKYRNRYYLWKGGVWLETALPLFCRVKVPHCKMWFVKSTFIGYPKYLVEYFLADTLFGSGVWLDLYHPCFISFLLFQTSLIHVSNHIKSQEMRPFLSPPHCYFASFSLLLHNFYS